MVTNGNHDIEVIPIFVEGFRAFNTRWQMLHKESGSDSNLYYSFEVAGVNVIMLGSYTDFDVDSTQYMWLQSNLMNVDRSRTPWVIVVLHAPWYNTNHAHQGNGDDMKLALEQTLYKSNVDIVVGSHVHAYELTTRVYANKVDPCGIMHMTVRDGGNREGLARKFYDKSPDWSVFREASFGHAELKIVNATHAHWPWHRNDDNEAVLADDFWITSLSAGHSECSFQQPSTQRILKPSASLRVGKGDCVLDQGRYARYENRFGIVPVGNIPYNATEEQLVHICEEVGLVVNFLLVLDRETGKPKGYGFCEFRDEETALSACQNLQGCKRQTQTHEWRPLCEDSLSFAIHLEKLR